MYGYELRHTQLANWKGKLVHTIFGETYPGHLVRFFINQRYFKKYAKKWDLRILEIGSNNGALVFWLSRNRIHTVIGLENDKTFVKDCQQIGARINQLNLYFVCADACKEFPLKASFDIMFSTHVLEHIPNDQAVLKNALKRLKPGGLLILQVPYGDPHKSPSKEATKNGHVRDGYTESHLCQLLVNSGFEIISASGSVGRVGRFAYRFARRVAKVRIIVNFSTLLFPITLILLYLEKAVASFRSREPSFRHGPLVVARRPL
ncbi:class I SAM-dependent methyltransferase [Thermodesulfobacteriota bacterium]